MLAVVLKLAGKTTWKYLYYRHIEQCQPHKMPAVPDLKGLWAHLRKKGIFGTSFRAIVLVILMWAVTHVVPPLLELGIQSRVVQLTEPAGYTTFQTGSHLLEPSLDLHLDEYNALLPRINSALGVRVDFSELASDTILIGLPSDDRDLEKLIRPGGEISVEFCVKMTRDQFQWGSGETSRGTFDRSRLEVCKQDLVVPAVRL